MTQKIL
jgi:chromosome segregation ATPase